MNRTSTGSIARPVDDEFLSLVYFDPEFVRAEFDAIVAAGWPGRPPRQPIDGAAGRPLGRRRRRALARDARHNIKPAMATISGPARQRSPPPVPRYVSR